MKRCLVNVFIITYIFFSCTRPGVSVSLQLTDQVLLDSVPSGSGTVMFKDTLYIFSDNATGFFTTDTSLRRLKFHSYFNADSFRIMEKAEKYDPETADVVNLRGWNYAWSFGSGSLQPNRQKLFSYNTHNAKLDTFDLTQFYDTLKLRYGIDEAVINFEAAASTSDSVYLFNRGNNSVVSFLINDLDEFLKTGKLPATNYSTIPIPQINGNQPGISGATWLNQHYLLITASVELTDNWVDDGEIAGSFLAVLQPTESGWKILEPGLLALEKNGKPLLEKLESVEVINSKENNYRIIATSDNDNGSTGVFKINLTLSNAKIERF